MLFRHVDSFGTAPEAEQKYKVVSNGTWLCGTDQSGRPFADPAPYKVTLQGLLVRHWCRTVPMCLIEERFYSEGLGWGYPHTKP